MSKCFRTAEVLASSNRGLSAYVLATHAIEHDGSGAETAARLLLSLEFGKGFNLQELYRFDAANRAHADIVIMGCQAHELWPSRWMADEGFDGKELMQQVRDKWLPAE